MLHVVSVSQYSKSGKPCAGITDRHTRAAGVIVERTLAVGALGVGAVGVGENSWKQRRRGIPGFPCRVCRAKI
jgi:hypothetical protein